MGAKTGATAGGEHSLARVGSLGASGSHPGASQTHRGIWFPQEVDTLDISSIRDTRTGRYARLPKVSDGAQVMDGSEAVGEGDSPLHPWLSLTQDPKIREVLGFGGPDARLEEKLMTVVAGPDPVNTTFLNFMAVQDDTAKVGWDRWLGLGELPPHC